MLYDIIYNIAIWTVVLEVLAAVSKINKTCTLILSEQQLVFTQNERATSGGVSMWCELKQVDFFV